jgi:hypothetical protein
VNRATDPLSARSRHNEASTNSAGEPKRLTENELSDFSWLCDDGCDEAIIEAQYVDRNHSTEI